MEVEGMNILDHGDQYIAGVIAICNRIERKDESFFYEPVSKERLKELATRLEQHFTQSHRTYITIQGQYIVLLFTNVDEEQAYKLVDIEREYLVEHLSYTEVSFGAVGNLAENVRKISESNHTAKKIVELMKLDEEEDMTKGYVDMGEYCLFLNMGNSECVAQYYRTTIKPLEDYDAEHGSNLVEVLRSYMNHNGNVADIATELFVRRSCIVKKLEKIQELLQVNLTHFDVRSRLNLGLMLSKIAKISEYVNM